jgi:hypothetical protein
MFWLEANMLVAVIKVLLQGININDPFGFAQSVILNKLKLNWDFRILEG